MNYQLLCLITFSYTVSALSSQDFLPTKISRSFHTEQEQTLEQLKFDQTLDSLEKRSNPYAAQAFSDIINHRLAHRTPVFITEYGLTTRCVIPSGNEFTSALQAVPETLSEIRPPRPLQLDDDIPLEKQVLEHAPARIGEIIESFKNRKKDNKRSINVLIYGQSGTGKTLLAESMAHALNIACFLYAGCRISNEYQDSGEVNLVRIFEHAALNAPCILAIDDIGCILNFRNPHPDAPLYPRLCALLNAYKEHPIIFMGNALEQNDFPDLLKQQCEVVELPLPNTQQRGDAFAFDFNQYSNDKYDFSSISITKLADFTEGFSYRTISTICGRAILKACRRDMKKIILCMHDFFNIIEEIDHIDEQVFKHKPRSKKRNSFMENLFGKKDTFKCRCKTPDQ